MNDVAARAMTTLDGSRPDPVASGRAAPTISVVVSRSSINRSDASVLDFSLPRT